MVHEHKDILCCLKKGDPVTGAQMEVSGRHRAKYASHERTNTVKFHLYKVPKVIESIEIGTSLAVQWLGLLTSTAGAHFQSWLGN